MIILLTNSNCRLCKESILSKHGTTNTATTTRVSIVVVVVVTAAAAGSSVRRRRLGEILLAYGEGPEDETLPPLPFRERREEEHRPTPSS